MKTTETEPEIRTLDFTTETRIAASIDIVFQIMLEEIGPKNQGGAGVPMPMKLEAWPGGRWYRDLGDNAGHFWGQVQVIKPPKLLEICGPMFMSYPAASHVKYVLATNGTDTLLTLTHRAFGLMAPEHIAGVKMGWPSQLERIRASAMKK